MKKIVIVDYGLGNLFSIKQALSAVGADAVFSSKAEDLLNCDGILLPGVGAFADAMNRLRELKLVEVIQQSAHNGKPILGVCLGLQLLFDQSHEFGLHKGLGLIPGEVVRFPESYEGVNLKVPFIGWNKLQLTASGKENSILSSLKDPINIYFVHSYYVRPTSAAVVLSLSSYRGVTFCSSLARGHVFGCQFHPERSGGDGLEIYRRISTAIRAGEPFGEAR